MKFIKPVISSMLIYGLFLNPALVNNDNKPVTSAPVIIQNAITTTVTTAETASVTNVITTTAVTTAPVTSIPEQTSEVTTTAPETTAAEPVIEEAPVRGVINGEMLYDTEYTEYNLPENPNYRGFKSYEPYDLITVQSIQLYLQQEAVTDVNGFRLLDNRYLVAVGTFCNAPCGTYIDLILENGILIPCIVGDVKSDAHTDETNTYTVNTMCASEFIVDDTVCPAVWTGDISTVYEEWKSKVAGVRVYNLNFREY